MLQDTSGQPSPKSSQKQTPGVTAPPAHVTAAQAGYSCSPHAERLRGRIQVHITSAKEVSKTPTASHRLSDGNKESFCWQDEERHLVLTGMITKAGVKKESFTRRDTQQKQDAISKQNYFNGERRFYRICPCMIAGLTRMLILPFPRRQNFKNVCYCWNSFINDTVM